jgi:hypothetical protein
MYGGALYVKGADGEWHLQASAVKTDSPVSDLSAPASIAYDAAFDIPEFSPEFQPVVPGEVAPAETRKSKPATKRATAKAKAPASGSTPAKKRSGTGRSRRPAEI